MEALIRQFVEDYGDGSGDGDGYGSGDGSGYGDGSGDGSGYGDGSGSGSGYGDGSGSGSGSGYGDGIKAVNGGNVYMIDDVATLISRVKGNISRGFILHSDLTLEPCHVVKQDGLFAHGKTLREAQAALMDKVLENSPAEERIDAFFTAHKAGEVYSNRDFFEWHHRLTGSCEMGRRQWAVDRGLSLDGSMTPEEFIRLTENAYGGHIIKQLKPLYGLED